MPDAERIREVMARYVDLLSAGDTDGILALYGDDPSVEDPVGSDPRCGRDTVHAFYAAAAGRLRVERTGPIRVAGCEGAMPMLAEIELGGGRKGYMDVIDTMRFDESGRIVEMRAFWNPDEIRDAR